MMDGNEAAARVVDALENLEIPYLLAGSFSSNYYGIPRSTRDADFVAVFEKGVTELADLLGEEFVLDPQTTFETVTGTYRDIIQVPSVPFKIELFHLSQDPSYWLACGFILRSGGALFLVFRLYFQLTQHNASDN